MFMLHYQTNNDVDYCIIIIGGAVPTTMTDTISNGNDNTVMHRGIIVSRIIFTIMLLHNTVTIIIISITL